LPRSVTRRSTIGPELGATTIQYVASKQAKSALSALNVRRLEKAIDDRDAEMPPLRAFVLPGGMPAAALLHQARTVCRRAERSVVTLAREADVDPRIIVYLNRLSDLLFVLARVEAGEAEPGTRGA